MRQGKAAPVPDVEPLVLALAIDVLELLQPRKDFCVGLELRNDFLWAVLGHVLEQKQGLIHMPPVIRLTMQSPSKNP